MLRNMSACAKPGASAPPARNHRATGSVSSLQEERKAEITTRTAVPMLSVIRLPVKALEWRMFRRAMTLKTANSTDEASANNEANRGFKEFSSLSLLYFAYALARALIAMRQESRIDPAHFLRTGVFTSLSQTRANETDDAKL